MKNTRLIHLLVGLLPLLATGCVNPTINARHFPDETFRNYVSQHFDLNGNGHLEEFEISQVKEIRVDSMAITDLKGIKYFVDLEILSCANNRLSELNISRNTALRWLSCKINHIENLNVKKNPKLKVLYCNNNELETLDLRRNPELEVLDCGGNAIAFQNGHVVLELHVSDYDRHMNFENVIEEHGIPLRENGDENEATSINIEYGGNNLTSLDLSQNPLLRYLSCGKNNISSLDLSQNPLLEEVYCDDLIEGLATLNLAAKPHLRVLDCDGNRLEELDVSQCPELEVLYCNGRYSIHKEHLARCTELDDYETSIKPANMLTHLDLRANPKLRVLECGAHWLSSMDLSKNPKLQHLWCYNNRLVGLNLSKNPELKELHLDNNPLTHLVINEHCPEDVEWGIKTFDTSHPYRAKSNRLDISQLKGFEPSRSSNWTGGRLNGSVIEFDDDADALQYDYAADSKWKIRFEIESPLKAKQKKTDE